MRVACLQLEARQRESVAERLDRVAARTEALSDADLIVLPELWLSGYFRFDEYESLAESVPGPVTERLGEAAAAAGAILVGGSLLERSSEGLHNTTVVFSPDGGLVATYRKVHVFGYRSRESELIVAGESPVVVDTAVGNVGLSTCYDLRFPEFFRAEVDGGADVFVIPAAWPEARADAWRTLLRARAIENQALVVACNGAGDDSGTALAGYSAVIGPWGDVIAEADTVPGELTCDVPAGVVADARGDFPALGDRTEVRPVRRWTCR